MKRDHIFVSVILLVAFTIVSGVAGAQEAAPYSITVEPIGHWHVYDAKTLIFGVHDLATAGGVVGLDLVAEIARTGSEGVTRRSVADGQIRDEGDGLYSLEYTPSVLGSYALIVHFERGGQMFSSAPVAFETARAGEEGIRAEADGIAYVYQIRYNWEPGHVHASDNEPVRLVFELIRSIPTGDAINWDQPWTNRFDHVTSVQNAVVQLAADDGAISEELDLVYRGRGIYEAERIFTVDEVGEERHYTILCSFTDAFNGAQVTLTEPATLHVAAAH